MAEQPMRGLRLEPTIAMRRGEQYVVQCVNCGALLAVSTLNGHRHPHELGPCPACHETRGWSQQHVPVGPYTAQWAHMLVGTAVQVAYCVDEDRPAALERLREAIQAARKSTRESKPWLVGDDAS
jgi:hypothetical protein